MSNIWRSEQEKCQILAICMFYNVHFLSSTLPENNLMELKREWIDSGFETAYKQMDNHLYGNGVVFCCL